MFPMKKKIGLDIGSTTIKCVVLDENDKIVYSSYKRHMSHILEKSIELLTYIKDEICKDDEVILSISGSAGMGLAENAGVNFVQEVYATRLACKRLAKDTDVVIELGGKLLAYQLLGEEAENSEVYSLLLGVGLAAVLFFILWYSINQHQSKIIRQRTQNEHDYAVKYCCPECHTSFKGKVYENILAEGRCPKCKAEYYESKN